MEICLQQLCRHCTKKKEIRNTVSPKLFEENFGAIFTVANSRKWRPNLILLISVVENLQHNSLVRPSSIGITCVRNPRSAIGVGSPDLSLSRDQFFLIP